MSPVIEPKGTQGAFITEEPATIMKSGDIPDVPIMIGATEHDGSFILATMYALRFGPQNLDKNATYMKQQLIPDMLSFINVPDSDPGNRAVASSVELTYLSGVNRSSWSESMPGLVDTMSVFAFKSAIQNTAEILSGRNRPVYLYSFEHHSNNTLWNSLFGQLAIPVDHGIAHADDLLYIFDYATTLSAQDQTFSEVMCDMWLNFGKFGNPTPSADSRFENWKLYDTSDEAYMKLNVTPTLQHGYRNSWRPNGFEWN